MHKSLFGQILINFNLVSKSQLERALELQRSNPDRPLGEILIEFGLLDEKTITSILGVQARKVALRAESSDKEDTESDGEGEGESEDTQPPLEVRSPEPSSLEDLLLRAKELGASDVHLAAGETPRVRLHGNLSCLDHAPLTSETMESLVLGHLSPEQRQELEASKTLDLGFEIEGHGRFRGNIHRHLGGFGACYRIVNDSIWSFRKLGLPPVVRQVTKYPHGLVLVTGMTGSGKSTTLASLIDIINRSQKKHIITIEDPIECIHENHDSIVSQREVPKNCPTFVAALEASLREDPDVIVVGEMRDLETMSTALIAAETGHLVFGTLHSRTAVSSVLRVLNQFPPESRSHVRTMLANNLRAVLSQELIPRLDGSGQCLASEVMIVNSAIQNMIREERINQIPSIIQMSARDGMYMMDDSLHKLLSQDQISIQDAYVRAQDKERFTQPA